MNDGDTEVMVGGLFQEVLVIKRSFGGRVHIFLLDLTDGEPGTAVGEAIVESGELRDALDIVEEVHHVPES